MTDDAGQQGPAGVAPLDEPSLYPRLDPTNLRDRLRTFPSQCRKAWDEATSFRLPLDYSQANRVVVMGMGGSAIGGDLLADLVSLEDSPPITVSRDYRVPSHVDERTLILACSHSGETEETLSGFRQALARGAKIVAVTGGGTLAAEAQANKVPVFRVPYVGEPRSALGYSFIVPTVLLMSLGLVSDKSSSFMEAAVVLDGLVPELDEGSPYEGNLAKRMASELLGRLVVIYGAGVFGSVARRWKTQLNENAKIWAFFDHLPEAHHNSVVGYPLPSSVNALAFAILLRPAQLHPRTVLRYEITSDLLAKESISQRTIEGRGDSLLSQVLSTILLGDYISYYLALLQGVDPSPVSVIDYVKERLAATENRG